MQARYNLRAVYLFFLVFLPIIKGFPQANNTLYFMDRVPQSQEMNPAFQPVCNFYYSLPGFQFSVGNNSISLNSIMHYDSNIDSVVYFLHDSVSKDRFINQLKDKNTLFFKDFQTQLFAFGFRISSFYFNFDMKQRADFDISYPRDLARFLIKGNKSKDSVSSFNFDGFDLDALTYTQFSLGISKSFDNVLFLGTKGKFLLGEANISADNKGMGLTTSLNKWHLQSDMTINAYLPYVDIPVKDAAGTVDWNNIGLKDKYKNPSNPMDLLPSVKNSMGFAFDFGVEYKGIDKLSLSASVIDFGFLRWKSDAYNLNLVGNYDYTGFNYNSNGNNQDVVSMVLDSIKNAFKMTRTTSNYTTWLPMKLYLGAEYSFTKWFSGGFLSMSRYYKKRVDQQFLVQANLKPLKMLEFSASYSFIDNGFSSFGAGMNLRLGPLNFFLVSDRIPLVYGKQFIPYKAEYFDMRLGMNMVFGCRGNAAQRKAKAKDKPFIYEE